MTSARKTCRKTRFDNVFEAEKWLKKMQRYVSKNSTVVSRIPQRVYECPFCHGYHATSRKFDNDSIDLPRPVERYRWQYPDDQ